MAITSDFRFYFSFLGRHEISSIEMHKRHNFRKFSLNGLPGIGRMGGPVGAIVLATGDMGITAEAMVKKNRW